MTNELKQNAADLLYLVSCAVNEESPDKALCDRMDLEEIHRLSCKHMLTTAAACALEKVMELPRFIQIDKLRSIRRQVMFDIERAKICTALEQHGIWHLPLKGILLKDLYPYSPMREMADNDILCDPSMTDQVRAIMQEYGYSCAHEDVSGHDVFVSKENVVFEMHRALFIEKEMPVFAAYYQDIQDRLILDADSTLRYRMTDEDFYIYLICHMYKHYHTSGTGLRSLVDLYIVNRTFGDRLDRAYLSAEFQKLGLGDYEQGTRALADKVFGREKLSQEEEQELSYYIESYGYGTADNLLTYQLSNDDSWISKIKYALRLTFPPCSALRVKYPILTHHPYLYPGMLVVRFFDSLVHHPKRSLNNYKVIKDFKKKDNTGIYNNRA